MSFTISAMTIEHKKVSSDHRSTYFSYTVTQTDGKIEKVRRCISENVKPCPDKWCAQQICKKEGVFPVNPKKPIHLLRATHAEKVDRGIEAPTKLFCTLISRTIIKQAPAQPNPLQQALDKLTKENQELKSNLSKVTIQLSNVTSTVKGLVSAQETVAADQKLLLQLIETRRSEISQLNTALQQSNQGNSDIKLRIGNLERDVQFIVAFLKSRTR